MEHVWIYLQQLVASNQFFQGGIVLAAISWAFYQLKAWPVLAWQKFKYLATHTIYFDDAVGGDFYHAFSEWFAERYPQKFRNIEVRLWWSETHSSGGQNQPVSSSDYSRRQGDSPGWTLRHFQYADSNVIVYHNRWLWIRKNRQEKQNSQQRDFINSYSISGLFAKAAIRHLCEEILAYKIAQTKNDALRVGVNSEHGNFDWKDVTIVKTFDHVFFEDKARLLKDLEKFLQQKEFYQERGINYKRSYLFYGPPGTGKTTLGTAIAHRLQYALYVINLAGVTSDVMLQRMSSYIGPKSVVLLEDIDCILAEREIKNNKLNFSTVLNFLDGIYAPSDCIFVLTTNHPEVLDEALIRKGRVDLSLEIGYPSIADVADFMSDFYGEEVLLAGPAGGTLKVGMAEIQDICLSNDVVGARRAILPLCWPKDSREHDSAVAESVYATV